jgi:hypothetical protein
VLVSGIAWGWGCVKVGIVGWSAGGEYIEGRGSLMTGWGRMVEEDVHRGRKWMRRGIQRSWEGISCGF